MGAYTIRHRCHSTGEREPQLPAGPERATIRPAVSSDTPSRRAAIGKGPPARRASPPLPHVPPGTMSSASRQSQRYASAPANRKTADHHPLEEPTTTPRRADHHPNRRAIHLRLLTVISI